MGLAETYSTLTRSPPPASPSPNAAPARKAAGSTARSASGATSMLMKPGPAGSARATPGASRSRAASACASSAGLRPAWRAQTIAALVAMSPCAASRAGVTSALAASSSGSPGSSASRADSTVARMSAKMS